MINDLDSTLRTLLKRELPPSLASQVAISFDPPDDQFPPQGVTMPAIDLFLYDVRENHDLRSNEWSVSRDSSGVARRSLPLVRIDCSYLITAWPSKGTPTPTEDEHRLLGETIMVLLRYPTLPCEVLQGQLRSQELPLPTSVLQPGQLQSLGEFWQALGGKPKAALNYTVTIAVQPFEAVEVPLVIGLRYRAETDTSLEERMDTEIRLRHVVSIAGAVRDKATSRPIGGALVEITECPPAFRALLAAKAADPAWARRRERLDRVYSRADGAFYFVDLPAGSYRLKVSAPEMGTRYGVVEVGPCEVQADPGEGPIPGGAGGRGSAADADSRDRHRCSDREADPRRARPPAGRHRCRKDRRRWCVRSEPADRRGADPPGHGPPVQT